MMGAANYLESTYPPNRGSDEPTVLTRPPAFTGVHGTVSVTVLCADPVIAAGLSTIFGSHRAFQMIPARETGVPNDNQPPADVILADYETAMHLARYAPQWMRRLLVYSNCDSETQIYQALESGARGYMLHGASIIELVRCSSLHTGWRGRVFPRRHGAYRQSCKWTSAHAQGGRCSSS